METRKIGNRYFSQKKKSDRPPGEPPSSILHYDETVHRRSERVHPVEMMIERCRIGSVIRGGHHHARIVICSTAVALAPGRRQKQIIVGSLFCVVGIPWQGRWYRTENVSYAILVKG
jgi:hypothetical protein